MDPKLEFEERRRLAREHQVSSPGRVHSLIRTQLRLGEHKRDESLVEEELMRTLGASRTAVRRAMDMLEEEGLIVRRPRHGTRVVSELIPVALTDMFPLSAGPRDRGVFIRQLTHRRIAASLALRGMLETDSPSISVFEQEIQRFGIPVALRIVYVPSEFLPDEVDETVLGHSVAADDWAGDFKHLFGVELAQIESTVEAAGADRWVARGLGVPEQSPVLVWEATMRGADERVRLLGYTYYRGDLMVLTVTNRKPADGDQDPR
jgi:DNA-binding GntR family transcriptional regulator